jgi:hypothetical protein
MAAPIIGSDGTRIPGSGSPTARSRHARRLAHRGLHPLIAPLRGRTAETITAWRPGLQRTLALWTQGIAAGNLKGVRSGDETTGDDVRIPRLSAREAVPQLRRGSSDLQGAAASEGLRQRSAARPILITTKLHPPAARDQMVPRERLLERLRGGSGLRLSLVACPAGFGKTTLLAAWREAEATRRPVAWLTVDEGDNDPVVFWSHAIEALRRVCPKIGEQVSAQMAGGADR